MNKVLDILAKTLSVLLYPLFIPTYGMLLFCQSYSTQVEPLTRVWSLVAVLGTFTLTCVIPLTAILILMRRGKVNDIQIADSSQRTMPYVYTALGFAFWCYLMIAILHAPLYLEMIAIGSTAAIALVAFINRFWKISAHLTAAGGLLGGLLSYCLGIGAMPTWGTWALWLSITLVLMFARLYVKAHTSAQVCAGWLLGIINTFVPYCIFYYAG